MADRKGGLLNYTTVIEPMKTAQDIIGLLVVHGASRIQLITDKGAISGIAFGIRVGDTELAYRLPINIKAIEDVLRAHRKKGRISISEYKITEQAPRTAWRILKAWVEVQMALVETGMAEPAEVFLPYLLTTGGDMTLYEVMREKWVALPEPKENEQEAGGTLEDGAE